MNDKADLEQNKIGAIRYGHHDWQYIYQERHVLGSDMNINNQKIHELR